MLGAFISPTSATVCLECTEISAIESINRLPEATATSTRNNNVSNNGRPVRKKSLLEKTILSKKIEKSIKVVTATNNGPPPCRFRKKEAERVGQNERRNHNNHPVITPASCVTATRIKLNNTERRKPPVTGKPPDRPERCFSPKP